LYFGLLMNYTRYAPAKDLEKLVECYWFVEGDETASKQEKIIPDGYPEMIFHYRDPYHININGEWQLQSPSLLAGQIRKNFYLKNTGASGIVGVKLRPSAVTYLFEIKMDTLADQVVDLQEILGQRFESIVTNINAQKSHEEMINLLNSFFLSQKQVEYDERIEGALALLFEKHGDVRVSDLTAKLTITERQLERLFKKYIGLSPKFYARIIRFSYIFQLMQVGDQSWLDIAFQSGYYDQAHFIRDFKAFSGEDPSAYLFDKKSMANFFMKREAKI
jgi:AraC-like DNA-binding protein